MEKSNNVYDFDSIETVANEDDLRLPVYLEVKYLKYNHLDSIWIPFYNENNKMFLQISGKNNDYGKIKSDLTTMKNRRSKVYFSIKHINIKKLVNCELI